MINIQEQVKVGFTRLSSEIRSLSSSVEPRSRISIPERKLIETSIENDDSFGLFEDNFGADSEQEKIEEINPVREDSFLGREIEYKDSVLQNKAQKQLVKKKRKEIRVICYYACVILYRLTNEFLVLLCNRYLIERNKNLVAKCKVRQISDRLYKEIR